MELFRTDNTAGYSENELAALNAEWERRAIDMGVEEGSDDYADESKWFADEVARR